MNVTRIADAIIYDGSLSDPFCGEVWFSGDRIIAVGAPPEGISADETIAAGGRVVC